MATPEKPVHKDFFHKAREARSGFRSLVNRVLSVLCVTLAFLALIPLLSIIFLVLKKGLPLLNWSVFTELPPAAGQVGGGFGNAVVGTLLMVGVALVLATPFGILSAIYVNEYAPYSRLANAVRFVAKLLTGIPSIICGVFAYAVIVLTTGGFSAWAGGFALAILILPTILLTAEQALIGVSKAYREASYGLGATNFQTIWRIVLPDALPAMMTGIMLAVARAAGETAPLIFTALFSQYWIQSLKEPTASLSVLIYNFSTVPFPHQIQMAWTASLVLVILVTIANISAQIVFRKK
ncbi:MAG: phosphate ABC transporter, permease protein PstA [Verrucomicrobia bacterium 61-8]|nr:MAG: phosphate ABC transporter, permease protein PstA [Verrucomicrobia bacterium 61-8]